MHSAFSVLFFAATASSQITTSVWMPKGWKTDQIGFYGSVMGIEGGHTTVALVYDNDTNTADASNFAETVTYAPGIFGTQTTVTEAKTSGDYTYSVQCKMPETTRAAATCSYSIGGALAHDFACADITQLPAAETGAPGSDARPEWCSGGATLPKDFAVDTFTLGPSEVDTYKIVITAGLERLDATAGASITDSNASPTGSQSSQTTSSISGSVSTGAAGPTETVEEPAEATGAAGTILLPGLGSIGVAIAAMIL